MHLLFDDRFPKHMLERGYEYYKEGFVRDVYKSENTYSTNVREKEKHHVEVEIEGDHILSMRCDCSCGDACIFVILMNSRLFF